MRNGVKRALKIAVAAFCLGMRWEVEGVATAYTVSQLVVVPGRCYLAFRLIGLPFKDFYRAVRPPVIATVTMMVAVTVVRLLALRMLAWEGARLLGLEVVVGVVVLVIVVSVGSFGLWGWNMFVEQTREALDANPVIAEHIGEIEEIEVDLEATGLAPGDDVFVFTITGSKGSGSVTAEMVTVDEDTEEIASGKLRLPDGQEIDLLEGAEPVAEPGGDASGETEP